MSSMVAPVFAAPRRRSLLARLWAGYELGRTRARLRELPEYMLADIGVTAQEARTEASRPSWDRPEWWRG